MSFAFSPLGKILKPCSFQTVYVLSSPVRFSLRSLSLSIAGDTNCPAVLTENLFMDNRQECDYLLSEAGKETLAQLHVNAILNYIAEQP